MGIHPLLEDAYCLEEPGAVVLGAGETVVRDDDTVHVGDEGPQAIAGRVQLTHPIHLAECHSSSASFRYILLTERAKTTVSTGSAVT